MFVSSGEGSKTLLLHTVPYLRRKDHFTSADRYGSWVADQDIVSAVLRHSSIDGVHFYLPYSGEYSKAEIPDGIAELRKEFSDKEIDLKRPSDLPALAATNHYVLVANFEVFSSLAIARYAQSRCLFPLSAIVHTIPRQGAFMGYADVLFLAEMFDTIITTSVAGHNAVRTIFQDVAEFVSTRLECVTPRLPHFTDIPLAVDEEFLKPRETESSRRQLGLPKEPLIIMYLGRFSETFKADLEPLLVAYRRLSMENPKLHLLIAGQDKDDKYAPVIRSLAREFGLGDRITIRTNFRYSDKPLFYGACDIFVSPVDNIQETFGLSITEAMASGVPVVASDWSGYRDLIIHGHSGFRVRTIWNPDSARLADIVAPFPVRSEHFLAQQTVVDVEELRRYLGILIDSEQLRHKAGSVGRELVLSRFSWKVVVKQYEEMWKSQWAQLETISKTRSWRSPVNLKRQFGHFATAFVDDAMLFGPDPNRELPKDVMNAGRIPYPIEAEEISRVMAECSLQPHSVGDLLSSDREATSTRAAVTWLWKKGYLKPLSA